MFLYFFEDYLSFYLSAARAEIYFYSLITALFNNIDIVLNKSYSLAIIYFNIFSYLILIFFFFVILSFLNTKFLVYLSDLKFIGKSTNISKLVILFFLVSAGMPPLINFCSKFLILASLISYSNLYLLLLFFCINFISIYFYLQNLRFLTAKSSKLHLNIYNFFPFFKFKLSILLVFLTFLVIYSVFFMEVYIVFFSKLALLTLNLV